VLHVIRGLTQLTNLMRLAQAVLGMVIDQAQLPEEKHSRQQQREHPQGPSIRDVHGTGARSWDPGHAHGPSGHARAEESPHNQAQLRQ